MTIQHGKYTLKIHPNSPKKSLVQLHNHLLMVGAGTADPAIVETVMDFVAFQTKRKATKIAVAAYAQLVEKAIEGEK